MDFDYAILKDNLLSTFTYVFLALSILSLWIRKKIAVWTSLLGIAIVLGLYTNRLQYLSLVVMAIGASITFYYYHTKNRIIKALCGCLLTLLAALLLFHKIPGFSNWQIVKNAQVSTDAIPCNIFLNFDTTTLALFILAFGPFVLLKTQSDIIKAFKTMLPIALLGIFVIMLLSIAMRYVKLDFKYGSLFFIWALNNLIFACFVEEVIFRGFIQNGLSTVFKKMRYGNYAALIIASLLFGLRHFMTIKYIVLASVAGFFYGWVYLKTKRIEASIVTHFMLNTVHFLAFTYPALALTE